MKRKAVANLLLIKRITNTSLIVIKKINIETVLEVKRITQNKFEEWINNCKNKGQIYSERKGKKFLCIHLFHFSLYFKKKNVISDIIKTIICNLEKKSNSFSFFTGRKKEKFLTSFGIDVLHPKQLLGSIFMEFQKFFFLFLFYFNFF